MLDLFVHKAKVNVRITELSMKTGLSTLLFLDSDDEANRFGLRFFASQYCCQRNNFDLILC